MMTLEEAITHCKEKACGNTQCALEHRQLAEWLKELQTLKSNNINYKEIEERYPLCINYSELKQQECAEFCGNYWKSIGATEQKAIDIDKACKWLDSYLMEIGYPDDWMRDSPNMESGKEKFRKAMEE